jgi:hypothetical protein
MGSFCPAGLGESQKALFWALGRASIACGVSVQKGAFDLHNVVQSAHDQSRKGGGRTGDGWTHQQEEVHQ